MSRTYDLIVETSFMYRTRFHFVQGDNNTWVIIPTKGKTNHKVIGVDPKNNQDGVPMTDFKGRKIVYLDDSKKRPKEVRTWKVKHIYGRMENPNNEITADFYRDDVVISTLDGYKKGPLTKKMKLNNWNKSVYTRIR